jgi:hypothetical protein
VPTEIAAPTPKVVTFVQGAGINLGAYPWFCKALEKLTDQDETLKVLHQFLYGASAKKFEFRRNIKKFSGFPIDVTSKEEKISKLTEKKSSWTVNRLKVVVDMCGLEKAGTRDELIAKLVDFMFCPSVAKVPVRKPPPSKKRQIEQVVHKKKRRANVVNSYSLYVQAVSAAAKVANPMANFGDIARLVAAQWRELGEEERAVSQYVGLSRDVLSIQCLVIDHKYLSNNFSVCLLLHVWTCGCRSMSKKRLNSLWLSSRQEPRLVRIAMITMIESTWAMEQRAMTLR